MDIHTRHRRPTRLHPHRRASGKTPAAVLSVAAIVALGACAEAPELQIETDQPLVTREDGSSVILAVSLIEPPLGPVIVEVASSNEGEGRVSGDLSFTAANWSEPQFVTVEGVDDATVDGDVAYEVTLRAYAASSGGSIATVETLEFINLDDDQATFVGLGDLPGGDVASYATDVDDSGNIVVGWSRTASGDEAIRWTTATGLVGLGGEDSQAHDISPNGVYVVGSIAPPPEFEALDEAGLSSVGVIWRGDAPLEILRGPDAAPYPGAPPLFIVIDGTVALDDGSVFCTSIQYAAYGERMGCRIDPAGVYEQVTNVSFIFEGDATGFWVGTLLTSRGSPYTWTTPVTSGPAPGLDYPAGSGCAIPHQCESAVLAFSADPTVLVGTAFVPPPCDSPYFPYGCPSDPRFDTAFVYTAAEGTLRLPEVANFDGDQESGAQAIDASGRIIGGFGATDAGPRAVVWIDRLPLLVADVVTAFGGTIPDGWILEEITAISPDGRVMVGNATNPDGAPEAFRVVFPDPL